MAASSNGPCNDRRPSDMFSLLGSSDDDPSDCPTNPNDAGSATTRLSVCAILKFVTRANGRGGQSPVWVVRSEEKSAPSEMWLGGEARLRERFWVRASREREGDDWKVGNRGVVGPCTVHGRGTFKFQGAWAVVAKLSWDKTLKRPTIN